LATGLAGLNSSARGRLRFVAVDGSHARGLAALIAVALSTVAFLQVWHLTRTGPGISPDSIDYVAAADSISSGHLARIPYASYNEPPPARPTALRSVAMTNFPPLFPALISATKALTGDSALAAARLLNALVLALTVAIVGWVMWRATGTVLWTGAAMAAIVFQPDMLRVSSMVWSEPSTILLLVGACFALTEYVARPRPWLLAVAGVLAGAAALDRFVAVGLVPVGLIAVWLAQAPRRRPSQSLIFGGLSLTPIIVWTVVRGGSSGNRGLVWHAWPLKMVGATAQTVYHWLSPLAIARLPVLLLCLAVLVAKAVSLVRRYAASPGGGGLVSSLARAPAGDRLGRLPVCLMVTGGALVCCGLALFAAGALFDLSLTWELRLPEFNPRILISLYGVAVVFLACVLAASSQRWSQRQVLAAWLAVVAVCAASIVGAVRQEGKIPADFAYATRSWRTSPTLALVRHLPPRDVVVTNMADFVWLQTGRTTVALPPVYFWQTGRTNPSYSSAVAQIREAITHGRSGWLALWSTANKPYLPDAQELQQLLPIRPGATTRDGTLFKILPGA
jgi:hypothetical protein